LKNNIAYFVPFVAQEDSSGKVFGWMLIKNFSSPFFLGDDLNHP